MDNPRVLARARGRVDAITEMVQRVGGENLRGKIESSVLNMLSWRCLFGLQGEMSSRQFSNQCPVQVQGESLGCRYTFRSNQYTDDI